MPRHHDQFRSTERKMQNIAKAVEKRLPKDWGFAVIVFPFNPLHRGTLYVSNANREDMTKALKETVMRFESQQDNPPGVDPRIYDPN